MKNFWCKISVTKLVFLITMICLCAFTGYQYVTGQEIKIQLRDNTVLAMIAFFFWQKWIKYDSPDSLVKDDKKDKLE